MSESESKTNPIETPKSPQTDEKKVNPEAEEFKTQGNKLFEEKKYQLASDFYTKGTHPHTHPHHSNNKQPHSQTTLPPGQTSQHHTYTLSHLGERDLFGVFDGSI